MDRDTQYKGVRCVQILIQHDLPLTVQLNFPLRMNNGIVKCIISPASRVYIYNTSTKVHRTTTAAESYYLQQTTR